MKNFLVICCLLIVPCIVRVSVKFWSECNIHLKHLISPLLTTQVHSTRYIEYIAGDESSRLMITVPHGGAIDEYLEGVMPIREGVSHLADSMTKQLGEQLQVDLAKELGEKPHLVIMNVHRKRLDANRDSEWTNQE